MANRMRKYMEQIDAEVVGVVEAKPMQPDGKHRRDMRPVLQHAANCFAEYEKTINACEESLRMAGESRACQKQWSDSMVANFTGAMLEGVLASPGALLEFEMWMDDVLCFVEEYGERVDLSPRQIAACVVECRNGGKPSHVAKMLTEWEN